MKRRNTDTPSSLSSQKGVRAVITRATSYVRRQTRSATAGWTCSCVTSRAHTAMTPIATWRRGRLRAGPSRTVVAARTDAHRAVAFLLDLGGAANWRRVASAVRSVHSEAAKFGAAARGTRTDDGDTDWPRASVTSERREEQAVLTEEVHGARERKTGGGKGGVRAAARRLRGRAVCGGVGGGVADAGRQKQARAQVAGASGGC